MGDNVQGLNGEYRRFTAGEVGALIRMYREQQGIKQAFLAADADVSLKTVERAESGEGISEESCRRIAKTLAMQPDSFTRELFIPSAEEVVRYLEREEAERKRTHSALTVKGLRSVRDVLSLFGNCAYLADDRCVEEQHLHAFAALKENFTDWADIGGDIPETERASAAEQLLTDIRAFEALGYVVKGGVVSKYLTGGPDGSAQSKFPFTFMVAFKKPKGSRDTTPAEVWLPKKMPMSF
jgi:transcriptional regulator with XRE-family HTH domain